MSRNLWLSLAEGSLWLSSMDENLLDEMIRADRFRYLMQGKATLATSNHSPALKLVQFQHYGPGLVELRYLKSQNLRETWASFV